MMLTHMGWADAADILISSFEKTLKEQKVTADFSSQISGCKPLSTIDFSRALISNM